MEKLYRLLWMLLFMLTSIGMYAQSRTVSGVVKDETGAGIPGASVIVKGTTTGTVTDSNGQYTIAVVDENTVLVISFIGYATQEFVVGNRATVDMALVPDTKLLDEVIVNGYTTQYKRDVTGAVSTISAKTINQTPAQDVTSVLQGRVAGVTVDGQGGPGNTQVIRVRGYGSLGNNDPLFVIDGVQTFEGLNLLNQNDIETMTVLKDAASCAPYGARGSNGVIVITTKRGKLGAPKIEINSYAGYEVPRKFPKMLSPQQYADAQYAADVTHLTSLYGNGTTPVLPDYVVEAGALTNRGVLSGDPAADPSLYNLNDYRIFQTNKNGTNWFKEVFKPAFIQSHQLNITGATDKANYAFTLNYLDQKGTMIESYFKRYSMRMNTEFKPLSWLKVGENLQIGFTQSNSVNDHGDQNVISDIYTASPLLPVYDIAGNLAGTKGANALGSNPVTRRIQSNGGKGYNSMILGGVYMDVEPIKHLVFQDRVTVDYSPYQGRNFQQPYPQEQYSSQYTTFSETAGYSLQWRNTIKASYDYAINKNNNLTAYVAYETAEISSRYVGGSTDSLYFTTPGYQTFQGGRFKNLFPYGGTDQVNYASVFGQVNYSLLDRYLVGVTVRRDGSSKFGYKRQYGTFPSASIGWRVSSENFMKPITFISDLKIRASMGTSGNEASLGSSQTFNQYSSDPSLTNYDLGGTNNSAMPGFALTQTGNPYLQWEVNKTTNLGFDAAFLDNRVSASFSWFNRKTDKLLYAPPVTALQGDAGAPVQNIMDFTNKGVELELGYNSAGTGDFRYEVNFNIASYRNNVNYINGDSGTMIPLGLYARQTPLSRATVGQPVSSFYGYVYEGIFQNADEVTNHAAQAGITTANGMGHFKFKDLNGDNVIDDKDRTFIGSPHPKFSYGMNINLYYKNFDASIFFQGVAGNKIFNYWKTSSNWPGKYGAGSLDTWTPENTDAKLPIYNSDNVGDDRPSSYFVENGSYMRVKNIQLGYTFKNIKGISKLRVYAQGYNLFTFTNYSGMDPEVSTGSPGSMGIDFGGYYPVSRKAILGINLTF